LAKSIIKPKSGQRLKSGSMRQLISLSVYTSPYSSPPIPGALIAQPVRSQVHYVAPSTSTTPAPDTLAVAAIAISTTSTSDIVTVATSIDTRVDSSFALVALADAASEEENEVATHATLTGVAQSPRLTTSLSESCVI